MLTVVCMMMAIAGIAFAGFYVWFDAITKKRLKEHQREWDAIKAKCDGFNDILDSYIEYCASLTPGMFVGKCFPRM